MMLTKMLQNIFRNFATAMALLCCMTAWGQDTRASLGEDRKAALLQEIYDELYITDDGDDDDDEPYNDICEEWITLEQNPQNINDMSAAELCDIPLITDRQATAIINYRNLYGDLRSMSELQMITALDNARCRLLSLLLYAKPSATASQHPQAALPALPADTLHHSTSRSWWPAITEPTRNSIVATMNIPTYERQGYTDGTYRGYAISHSIRYMLRSKRLQVGLTAAQDAGEPFFSGTNKKGWDFYTGFVRLKNSGIIDDAVVGHYQLSAGMGLILNSSYRLSRTSLLLTAPSVETRMHGHSSRQESNYLQGAAVRLALPWFNGSQTAGRRSRAGVATGATATIFMSYRPLDATMSATEPQTISTILKTGYHRTDSEIARRSASRQTVAGASLAYSSKMLRIALNAMYIHLRDSLSPDRTQPYKRYYPGGQNFATGSVAYAYLSRHWQLSGETAVSEAARKDATQSGGVALATANYLQCKLIPRWTLFAMQRFYSYRFQSLLGRSFGDMSSSQNESGLYVGATTTAVRHLSLSAYIDAAYHPWARYGYDDASRSWDTYLLATYTNGSITASLRYRYREQALADDASVMPAYSGDINGTTQHTARASLKMTSRHVTSLTQLSGTYIAFVDDWGYAVSEAVGYNTKAWSAWCSVAYFDTQSYTSRIYFFDRNVAYGSTSSMLYGQGLRLNIMLSAELIHGLTASAVCNVLHYFDRSVISSGAQQIDSSNKTDIALQLAYRF